MQQIYGLLRYSPSSVNAQPWHFIVASTPEARAHMAKGRQGYVNLHRYAQKDLPQWLEKQAYIALGSAMLGAASLGVDTTPMEGIDVAALDAEFGLHEQGLASLVMLSFGYHAEADFNAALPKSRLGEEQVFTFL